MNEQQIEILGAYQRVIAIVWRRLSPTFGIRTVGAITRQVIIRSAKRYPVLAMLKLGDDGVEWGAFEASIERVGLAELRQMLDQLMDDFFEALASLMGDLVVRKIFKGTEEILPPTYMPPPKDGEE